MSWQEELRRLDADLAGGKISRQEYRKQRDELLAAASGGGAPSPLAAPLAPVGGTPHPNGWQSTNPGWFTTGSAQPRPEPPPQPQPPPPTPAESGDKASALLTSGRPTSAPSPADQRPTDSIRYPALSEAPTVITQPVNPPGLVPPAARFHPAPPLPSGGRRRASRHCSGIIRQHSLPLREKPLGRRPTWLFLSLAVLVVLGMIMGATWLLGRNGGPPAPTANAASTATPALADRLPALPGTPDANSSTVAVDKGVRLGLYPAQAAEEFTRNHVNEVVYRGSVQGDDAYFVLAIPARNASEAKAVVAYLRTSALSSGFTALPGDPTVVTGKDGNRLTNGTWYASDNIAVVIWVSQPATLEAVRLSQHLGQTRSSLQEALPAR
ncbi:MAG TPA: hypothetical protein VJT49_16570 [Amycolatopsis sp.]|uniref:hypothetical protein n=1 Tax=Amycolatopsis sp. TaxID=37632 RepID=UPI002B48D54B|nr:hypothetical protein [Amycolatopsis sp.]HKS46689.1 hypothetical protein [Amycolatopsis sp.]